ncbi:hypothetical protein B0J13DRAFT_585520 [Dactylonectria estremocensis]|uniref:LDB19 N-terminal domain-containing protein n=1 Tax=Dactylonectria estremocensis TaxID=1079267 RepID=A0A9P9ERJ0_9HYPO|nr:hypothetical protein B0J13DRAFT_585520 [Dactylonectria estremocensis]
MAEPSQISKPDRIFPISIFSPKSPNSTTAAVTLSWTLESPSITLFDKGADGVGALFSGLLFVHVAGDFVEVDALVASLSIQLRRRPSQSRWGSCVDCQIQPINIETWNFLSSPTTLSRGTHQFPFSSFVPGHYPATVNIPALSISYNLKATIDVARSANQHTISNNSIELKNSIMVKRVSSQPKPPHHLYVELQPLKARVRVLYDRVIEPEGANQVVLHLVNLLDYDEIPQRIVFWRLTSVSWKFEEIIQHSFPLCKHHTTPFRTANEPTTDIRVLAKGIVRKVWETDGIGGDGTADLKFSYAIDRQRFPGHECRYACDVKPFYGLAAKHSLEIEIFLSQETAPESKPHLVAPTTKGFFHRLRFDINLMRHADGEVNWDEETPPVYQDAASQPPAYTEEEA